MTLAFEGPKVIDFTQVLAAPFATQQLAALGARYPDFPDARTRFKRSEQVNERTGLRYAKHEVAALRTD